MKFPNDLEFDQANEFERDGKTYVDGIVIDGDPMVPQFYGKVFDANKVFIETLLARSNAFDTLMLLLDEVLVDEQEVEDRELVVGVSENLQERISRTLLGLRAA